MERGFEQLIVIAAIILAGVFDMIVRWLKSRQQKRGPVDARHYDEDRVLVEEGADFDLPSDIDLSGEELAERPLSREELVERAQSREEQVERALSREDLVERAPFEEGLVERRIPVVPPPVPAPAVSRRAAPPPLPPSRQRRVSRRLLTGPLDARRGIVMMTILGPCRGLERPDREA